MDSSRHTGRVAIVTGASSGIGRATIFRLAAEGARVIGCDVNDNTIEETRTALTEAGVDATLLKADITDQGDVGRIVAEAGDRIDILANVAGIMDHFLPLDEVDDATWDRVLAVNLTGVMRLSRAVLPLMKAAGGGAIVTVGSKASLGAGASGVAYTSSKHGVIGLIRHIAFFYAADGIRSNGVLPGPVDTGIGSSAAPKSDWAMQSAMRTMATMPQVPAQPDEVAALVSWLASDEASYVNGALVTVDNGWSAA
jgi:NAD(P)-dependent dehydrogenase (short-subunit alcohol dehydrogenase family)